MTTPRTAGKKLDGSTRADLHRELGSNLFKLGSHDEENTSPKRSGSQVPVVT